LFVAAWVVAGALENAYSHLDQGISELGARGASHPLIVNAGLVVLGLSLAALGAALPRALAPRRSARVACSLFVAAGAGLVVAGVVPLDCGLSHDRCEQMWRAGELTWRTDAHLWAALVSQVLIALTPFAIARALWPGPVAPLALGSGAFGLSLGVVAFALNTSTGSPDGLVQRLSLAVLHVWVVIVAAGILHATREAPPPGELVRLRPRDFFARAWSGQGELVVRPFLFWRLFPQRFEAHRSSTWITDRVWRIEDEARYGDGRVQRRRMYCEFLSDERVEITGGDMPEGASVVIEPDGFRVVPFRMEFPIGPVNLPIRVHDRSRIEPDGTLVNAFDARSLVFGVTLARVVFRMRPAEDP
jgi:hypothetical protein